MFEVVSDAKMKEAGYFLFDLSETREQLLVETGLDIEPVIIDEVNKHLERAKEFARKKWSFQGESGGIEDEKSSKY